MATDAFNHAPGQILMNTGSQQFGQPSLGAWTLYGLGSESQNLPGFVVFSTGKKGPSGGHGRTGAAASCRPSTRACTFRTSGDPVLFLSNPPRRRRPSCSATRSTRSTRSTTSISTRSAIRKSPRGSTRSRWPTACSRARPRRSTSRSEPEHILEMYGAEPGKPSFANTCLLARRLVERGVRFVEIFHEAWDQHGDLTKDIKKNCRDTDQACAALVNDLKQRGLLDDTLVIWGGEFGRTPMVQGDGRRRPRPSSQRLHHVAGRRRHSSRASSTARATTSASTSPRTRSTSTTCTPRSCTCWASTTSGSRTSSRASTRS